MKTRLAVIHRIAIALLSIAAAAQAMAITVTNTSDGAAPGPAGSLRKAINDAAAGDTIDFASSVTGTITLTSGQLVISKNMTLVGPGARVLGVSGNNAGRVIFISRNITATVSGLTIRDGFSSPATDSSAYSRNGGGIFNDGNLTLIGCKITANRVEAPAPAGNAIPLQANGAGIVNYIASTLTMRECEISYNVAHATDAFGCGLYNVGTATLTNCTISNNQIELIGNFPDGRGAGIRNVRFGSFGGSNPYNQYGLATLRLVNSTVTHNVLGAGGTGAGIQRSSDAPTYLRNTIVAGNTAPDRPDVSSEGGVGVFNSEGHNLIGIIDGTGGWITDANDPNRDYTGTAAQPLDPGLVDPDGSFSPVNNGGPTNTVALLSTSAAVDRGDDVVVGPPYNLANDQRGPGFPRKLGAHTDIGAFELDEPQVGPDFVVTTTDEHSDGLCGIADCTLIEALDASNANASANTITFAPGVSGTIFTSFGPGRSITHPLTITGPGARALTIDGKGSRRVFNIQAAAGSVAISGLTLANGKAGSSGAFPNGWGGAILNAASLTLTDCTLSGNSSAVHGGAILNNGSNSGTATLTLNNCTLTGNSSTAAGGAIFNLGSASGHATLNLTNCTLSGNSASQSGGAIYNDGTNAGNAALTLTNCTFSQNTATLVAGGIYNDAFNSGQAQGAATVALRNTIFRSGVNGANLVNEQGTITSQGANLSSDAAGGDTSTSPGGFLNQAGDMRNTDPKLGGLQSNGGPTDTIALQADSPAINAGNDALAPSTDQRGKPRIGVSDIGAFEFTPAPTPGSLGNVSTRLQVGTGNNVLFAGFIIQGNASKTLLIRSAGPSLTQFGVPGALGDPQLELHDANNTIGTNDNWQTTQIGGVITSDQTAAIQNSGAPPLNPAEPAIIATLPAGSYSAVVQGVGGTQGVATVEVYDLSQNNGAILANISTRGFIQTGDNVMIGGFIVVGNPSKVLVRATGPSLIPFGISNALANPRLELHDGNGTLAANDDWQTTQIGGIITTDQSAAIQSSGLAPSNAAESAIIATLAPGNYTAIAQGVNGGTGVGLIEVFALP
jgi:predicted outer membrane repeat protein